jgi:hypothetical protein
MALSEDQRALLGLLLGGDTYERVAEVIGASPEEVRERAHRAAEAIEGDADGDIRASAVQERLAVLEGAPPSERSPETHGDQGRRRLALWIVGGGAAVVLVVVLLIVTLTGGGGSGDEGATTVGSDQEDAVPVRLSPVGGSRASGGLTILRVADQPAVDLDIHGLTPTRSGQTYMLWFVGAGDRGLPIAFQAVGEDGSMTGRTPIPTAAAGLLPSLDTAKLTLTRQRAAAAAVNQAAQSDTLPEAVGASVLRGSLR